MAQEFSIALTHEAVSSVVPEREALVWRDRRLTYADLTDRSRRLATYLRQAGLGVRRERSALANYESGQDHVGLYLLNGNEYLEGMLGAFKAPCAPVNVNYHPAVLDVIVCGRPSERWGSEIVAVAQVTSGGQVTEAELQAHLAQRLARYKLPKCWVFVNQVQRSPSGKADYRWARSVAEKASAQALRP